MEPYIFKNVEIMFKIRKHRLCLMNMGHIERTSPNKKMFFCMYLEVQNLVQIGPLVTEIQNLWKIYVHSYLIPDLFLSYGKYKKISMKVLFFYSTHGYQVLGNSINCVKSFKCSISLKMSASIEQFKFK